MIAFYNSELLRHQASQPARTPVDLEKSISNDPTKISWSSSLKSSFGRGLRGTHCNRYLRMGIYRPFNKQYIYCDNMFIHRPAIANRYFPLPDTKNLAICVHGLNGSKPFTALAVNILPDLNLLDAGCQCFPRYRYEKSSGKSADVLGKEAGYHRIDNIPPATVATFQSHYKDARIDGDSIFYYVYGILHHDGYKSRFAADLKKTLPRIPHAKNAADFRAFSEAGKQLAHLHANYESVAPHPLLVREQNAGDNADYFKVRKMDYAGGRNPDKSIIQYNANITLENIPPDAHQYIVNGKTALDWVINRYQIKTDKKHSKITNDPNDWSDDPRHIIDLIRKVVSLSVETVTITRTLPELP